MWQANSLAILVRVVHSEKQFATKRICFATFDRNVVMDPKIMANETFHPYLMYHSVLVTCLSNYLFFHSQVFHPAYTLYLGTWHNE
jgi:hypothetical protein